MTELVLFKGKLLAKLKKLNKLQTTAQFYQFGLNF